ncbi:Regulatory-associated protein of mTOR [Galdieria sulphuraria]|nr:Regulatory-associated protein of mTOR [Galdieria sulphuraria]
MSLWNYLLNSEHLELLDAVEARKTAALAGDSHIESWRIRYRLKTVCVALVVCLNVGVDPPDVVKPKPCARLECWIDPTALPSQKAIESIGKALQLQYERWQPRARYKVAADPTVEEVKKLCVSLRRSAKEERVLFHYNGHGVPRPTANGEIWVFNKNYTQYIPLSLYDLQTWLGVPSIYVFDCSSGGLALSCFLQLAEHRINEQKTAQIEGRIQQEDTQAAYFQDRKITERESPSASDFSNLTESSSFKDSILLAACRGDEVLPTNPNYPADIFTACLTTPIKIALRWFLSRTMVSGLSVEMLDHIPGKLNDRKTMLGELNWIFTAITDTIAWNTLPRPLFKRLFRQDLLVASLFRNYILAERVMKSLNCTPVTHPELPPMYNHPLWQSWDYTVELCLAQLPAILSSAEAAGISRESIDGSLASVPSPTVSDSQSVDSVNFSEDNRSSRYIDQVPYDPIPFFDDQITAFEIWLDMADEQEDAPEQLPIVLQVLLSQSYRLRALRLLSRFFELGSWAVDLGLSVGIFPYVLKLLQSPSKEIREELVYIWGKIVCQDHSCAVDLVRDGGHLYFVDFLEYEDTPEECKTMALYVLSVVSTVLPDKLKETRIMNTLISQCKDMHSAMVRKWAFLCLAKMFKHVPSAIDEVVNLDELMRLIVLSTRQDESPEVRASVLYTLEFFPPVKVVYFQNEAFDLPPSLMPLSFDDAVLPLILYLIHVCSQEASPIVRREAAKLAVRTKKHLREQNVSSTEHDNRTVHIVLEFLYEVLKYLSTDPQTEISALVQEVLKDTSVCTNDEQTQRGTLQKRSGEHTDATSNVSSLSSSPGSLEEALPTRKDSLSRSTNSMPRVMSIEGISQLFRGFTSKGKFQEASLKSNSFPQYSHSVGREAVVSDRPWHLPSLYDWSQGTIMYLRAPHSVETPNLYPNSTFGVKDMTTLSNWRAVSRVDSDSIADSKVKSLKEVAILDMGGGSVTSLAFGTGTTLLVGSSKGELSEWDYQKGIRKQSFLNSEDAVSHIFYGGDMELKYIDDNFSIVITGSKYGQVKIWRLYKDKPTLRLISSWRNFDRTYYDSSIQNRKRLVMSCNTFTARVASNSSGFLNIWDIPSERLLKRYYLGEKTELCSASWTCPIEIMGPHVVFSGTSNGNIILADTRCSEDEITTIQVDDIHGHREVISVDSQRTAACDRLLSASGSGRIAIWDPRKITQKRESLMLELEAYRGELSTMTARSNASTIFAGSGKNCVKIFGSQGSMLRMIRYHEGSMSTQIGPVTSIVCHPESPKFAFGCSDSVVSVYD